jgi:hypothetical protein
MCKKIQFKKKDIEKILEIINKFPEQDKNYELEYTESSGLGYCLDLILPHSINGVEGELKVSIVDVDQW